jgi:lipoate synthase
VCGFIEIDHANLMDAIVKTECRRLASAPHQLEIKYIVGFRFSPTVQYSRLAGR